MTVSCYFPQGTMLWVLFLLQFMFCMAGACFVEERIALMHIRSSLLENKMYKLNVPETWGRSEDCCTWERVTCNSSSRVSRLNLNYMHFPYYGDPCWDFNLTIISSFHELQLLDLYGNDACLHNFEGLEELTELRYLNLSANFLTGDNVLESLGRLSSLEAINFEYSRMSGALQNIAFKNLKNLRELRLRGNQLNGSIPACLFELPRLEYLDLSANLLQGHIPVSSSSNLPLLIQNLTLSKRLNLNDMFDFVWARNCTVLKDHTRTLKTLRELHLEFNQFSGSIPAWLFELPRLEYLDLSGNLLQGRIPISLSSDISISLKTIKLAGNSLNGKFNFFWLRNYAMLKEVDLSWNTELAVDVKFLTSVTPFQLRALRLSGCNLDNSIIAGPNLFVTQRHIKFLDLSNNNLAGSLPTWMFSNETALTYLGVANNSLVGSLDLMWQQQSNLQGINISMNFFTGQLPMDIRSVFPNLRVLDASYNHIFGHLPSSLCNISNLQFVDLSNNKLTGEVPSCLFTDCSLLQFLKLSNNNLGGPILGGANNHFSNVSEIYLDSNYFEGALPKNISGYMIIMDFHDNKLSGELDVSFWNISSLSFFSVASNNLNGQIYPTICNMTVLYYLDISDNDFQGSIPNCINKLPLHFLNMSSNTLSGFPGFFLNSSKAIVLDLRYNQFKGSLDWIQDLSQIKMLLLGGNRFKGQIPTNLCHLEYLNIVDLSRNKLSGSLPACIGGISFGYLTDDDYYLFPFSYGLDFNVGRLSNMDSDDIPFFYDADYVLQGFTFSTKGNVYTYSRSFFNLMSGIDLSANMLSGEIPWEVGNLSHVKSLNLSHNFFTGQIPAAIANMSAMESLDLSHNELSGPLPWQMTQMSSLEVFSVAYNNLSGCIPNLGQFSSFSGESYLGNVNLHNLSEGNRCSVITCPMEVGDVDEATDDLVLYIISAASFVLAFWTTVAFLFCHSLGRRLVLQL